MKLDTLRITWLSNRIPTTLLAGGVLPGSGDVSAAWTAPGSAPPFPFPWRYPWLDPRGKAVGPDDIHWLEWLGLKVFTGGVDPSFVARLMERAVPLLADVPLQAGAAAPPLTSLRAELFLHPWAVSAAVSATLQLPPDTGIAAAVAAATAYRDSQSLVATGLGPAGPATPADLAEGLAEASLALTGATTTPATAQLPPVVVATVISGDPGARSLTRPVPENQAFADAMHELAGDFERGSPVRWIRMDSAGGPQCAEARLCQVLTTGVSQWFHDAIETMPRDDAQRTGTRHRRAVLRLVVARSVHALFGRRSQPADPLWLRSTSTELRRLAGIHYGPAKDHRDFLIQAYVDLHELNNVLGNPTRQFLARCPDA